MNLILAFFSISIESGKQGKPFLSSLLVILSLFFLNLSNAQAQEQNKESRIIAIFWGDAEGKAIDFAKTGEEVYMHIHTENMIGKTITIDTRDEEVLYEYDGEPLVSQVVEHVLVVDDIMKVEFKAIGRITRLSDLYWDRIKKPWWKSFWHKKAKEYNKNIKRLRKNYIPMVF